jgi:mannose/fructose/N-acetylgalactosamine-specific phosphotransferase system component IID
MMGIKKRGGQPVTSFFVALVLTAVAAGFGFSGLIVTPMIFGVLIPLSWALTSEPVYSCPSCKSELKR